MPRSILSQSTTLRSSKFAMEMFACQRLIPLHRPHMGSYASGSEPDWRCGIGKAGGKGEVRGGVRLK